MAQKRAPILAGFYPTAPSNNMATLALSTAATWLAYGFTPDASQTLAAVKVQCSAVTGTLTALSCDIYSDTAGVPTSSLQSSTTVTALPASGTAPMTVEFTGFTLALTAGVQYWIVLKNTTSVPASNFPTYTFGAGNTGTPFSGVPVGLSVYGWLKKHSTNSGGAWATAVSTNLGWRLQYSDATYAGMMITQIGSAAAATGVFSTHEVGVLITTPANATWNIRGISFYMTKVGTPTGFLRYRLYNDTALLGTTYAIPAVANITSAEWTTLYFSAPVVVAGGTSLRITAGETTQSDANTNAYRMTDMTIENDANSKALLPFGAQRTYYDGSSWAQTSTVVHPFVLLLDTDAEFGAASGTLPLGHPGMTGRMAG